MLVDTKEQLLENITEIVPGVFLANNNVAANLEFYEKYNIKAVLNCSVDLPFYKPGIHQLRISIHDTPDAVKEFYKCLDLHTNQSLFIALLE